MNITIITNDIGTLSTFAGTYNVVRKRDDRTVRNRYITLQRLRSSFQDPRVSNIERHHSMCWMFTNLDHLIQTQL